jgi:hypothetical protein
VSTGILSRYNIFQLRPSRGRNGFLCYTIPLIMHTVANHVPIQPIHTFLSSLSFSIPLFSAWSSGISKFSDLQYEKVCAVNGSAPYKFIKENVESRVIKRFRVQGIGLCMYVRSGACDLESYPTETESQGHRETERWYTE